MTKAAEVYSQFLTDELSRLNAPEFTEPLQTFLEELAEVTDYHESAMRELISLADQLAQRRPATPITEDDFDEPDEHGIARCTRYSTVYRKDDKYYDDRHTAYQTKDSSPTDRMYVYQSGTSSKREVTLPYLPIERIEVLK